MSWRRLVILFCIVVGVGWLVNKTPAQIPSPKLQIPINTPRTQVSITQSGETRVSRVIDGDTVELENKQKVRLIGIDAPELAGEECFAKEATQEMVKLVEGKEVRLEKDVSEVDRYGRLLRYVYLGEEMVNKTMVAGGFAHASSYPPDIQYQDLLRQAESEAREGYKGLWGGCGGP